MERVKFAKSNGECEGATVIYRGRIRGIKFYPGLADLKSSGGFLKVDLVQERHNPQDINAILAVTKSLTPKPLGHLEKAVSVAVARIMDLKLPNTRMKRYNQTTIVTACNTIVDVIQVVFLAE